MQITNNNLLAARDFIAAHPERFDMRDWAQSAPCGTVCCIAGWAVALSQPTEDWTLDEIRAAMASISWGWSDRERALFQPGTPWALIGAATAIGAIDLYLAGASADSIEDYYAASVAFSVS